MDAEDFWIGDNVKIRSTGQLGKVEGEEKGGLFKVRIKGTDDHVSVSAADLEKIKVKPQPKTIEHKPKRHNLLESVYFKPTIDLHINELTDYNPNDWKADELSFQKHCCLKFLKKAVKLRVPRVEIIHGKGEGVLKSCVEDLLREFMEVQRTSATNNGGAIEIWFRYH